MLILELLQIPHLLQQLQILIPLLARLVHHYFVLVLLELEVYLVGELLYFYVEVEDHCVELVYLAFFLGFVAEVGLVLGF